MQLAAHHWDLRRGEPISVAVEAWAWTTSRGLGLDSSKYVLQWLSDKPAIAQLVEHLTVETCSNQMVPGSIPGGRTCPLLYHELEARGVRLHISWGAWVALGPWLPWPARRPPPPLPFPKLRSSCSPQRGPRAATLQFGEGKGEGRGGERASLPQNAVWVGSWFC